MKQFFLFFFFFFMQAKTYFALFFLAVCHFPPTHNGKLKKDTTIASSDYRRLTALSVRSHNNKLYFKPSIKRMDSLIST